VTISTGLSGGITLGNRIVQCIVPPSVGSDPPVVRLPRSSDYRCDTNQGPSAFNLGDGVRSGVVDGLAPWSPASEESGQVLPSTRLSGNRMPVRLSLGIRDNLQSASTCPVADDALSAERPVCETPSSTVTYRRDADGPIARTLGR